MKKFELKTIQTDFPNVKIKVSVALKLFDITLIDSFILTKDDWKSINF